MHVAHSAIVIDEDGGRSIPSGCWCPFELGKESKGWGLQLINGDALTRFGGELDFVFAAGAGFVLPLTFGGFAVEATGAFRYSTINQSLWEVTISRHESYG